MATKRKTTTAAAKRKRAARRATTKPADAPAAAPQQGQALTIIYVHGIGPKPRPDVLKCQWDFALKGADLGDRSRMAFWMNEAYHDYLDETCEPHGENWPLEVGRMAEGLAASAADIDSIDAFPPESRVAMRNLAKELGKAAEHSLAFDPDEEASEAEHGVFQPKVIPAPRPVRQLIARVVTRTFLRDVHDFLFRKERRDFMCESLRERIMAGGGPFVVIGHSQGSMIAYHVLRQLPASVPVPLFLTIGSPLGLQEVRDRLPRLDGAGRLAMPSCVDRWVNVNDRRDIVAARQKIGRFYPGSGSRKVEDQTWRNMERATNPHSGVGYLAIPKVQQLVRETMAWSDSGLISPAYISRDLSADLERAAPQQRLPVLIELLTDEAEGEKPEDMKAVQNRVVDWITTQVGGSGSGASADDVAKEIDLEKLHAYVAARLTRNEVERMVSNLALRRDAVPQLGAPGGRDPAVWRVFSNLEKSALVWQSSAVVQATVGRLGYNADGAGINWAVLDSGIDARHPHFHSHNTIAANWNCVPRGAIREVGGIPYIDKTGHGTHVAGIIAGAMPALDVDSVAPRTRLHIYRVLDEAGRGRDATIIKALDHIYDLNLGSPELRIHGVNLSLGGPFDPRAFGCGDSPLCKQLHRLWRQGVLVVIASGNEGFREVMLSSYGSAGLNMNLSIADPANLDPAIAVGSVHATRPHFYGVSYFSSRGPTADGRAKPDLVAPGERIRSCRSFGEPNDSVPPEPSGKPSASNLAEARETFYREDSGTSMAAPHVSGLLAAYLSVRREFIGQPDRVKKILLEHCTDLHRHRMHQGAGLPNLVKMLLNT